MKGLSIAVAACLSLSACLPMSDDRATRAVEAAGMKNVRVTGAPFFGCGEGDGFHASFEAENAKGEKVTGVVCGGIFKGSTVRVD